jgi:uncharacterized protein (TIGR02145 family)
MKSKICCLLIIVSTSYVFSQTKKEQIDVLTSRIDSLNIELKISISTIQDRDDKISKLDLQVKNLNEQLNLLNQQLKIARDSVNLLNDEIKNLLQEKEAQIHTVTIGTQVWTSKNLDVTTFRNGDPIPEAKTAEEWLEAAKSKKPAYCYYDYNAANDIKYGKLYNWYAVVDSRGLAPMGWHIPTVSEWKVLTDYLGGDWVAGKKLKSTTEWNENGNGTNESGFSGIPGSLSSWLGGFMPLGFQGEWWCSELYLDSAPYAFVLDYSSDYNTECDGEICLSTNDAGDGRSVRCIKDK